MEEPSFKAQLRQLRISYRDLDLALEDLDMTVCRRPEIFPQVLDTGVHRLRVRGYGRFPDIDIWFTFDSNHVYLNYIELAPEDD